MSTEVGFCTGTTGTRRSRRSARYRAAQHDVVVVLCVRCGAAVRYAGSGRGHRRGHRRGEIQRGFCSGLFYVDMWSRQEQWGSGARV